MSVELDADPPYRPSRIPQPARDGYVARGAARARAIIARREILGVVSQENVEFVRSWVEAFNAQDLDVVNAMYAEDCEYVIAERSIHLRGRGAQRALMERFLAALPDRRMAIGRIISMGNLVACEIEYHGTVAQAMPGFPPVGERYRRALCCVFEIEEGHIRYERDYRD